MPSSTLPPKNDQDDLVFLEEQPNDDATPITSNNVWRIMIIDDDEDVHSATSFALGNLEMQHRPLQFVHAYSAREAREILQKELEIAVILLDVVMEADDAGLQLVRYIRETLKMSDVRIILRTGQPGYAPEIDAIRDFDINDYKTKSELTRIKLYTTVTAAIRSYEQIRTISASRRGLDLIVHASTELMALHGLQNFAAGVITQIAGLLSLQPEGLICAQESGGKQSEFIIIAGGGTYQGLVNRSVHHLADQRISDALRKTIIEKCNIYAISFTTLHFLGKSGREFVAFLDTDTPLGEIDQRLLEVFCSNISVGLDNVILVSHLHDFAFYDRLTKLPNRTRLIELLDEILNQEVPSKMTLSLVDIDHFSETNDALGHQFGDMLLLAVSERLKSLLDNELTLARVGSDIFAILGNSQQITPDLLASLFKSPFLIDEQTVQLSVTVGLVRLEDYEGNGANALKDADITLKRAKLQQRSGHFYFSRTMGAEVRERVRLMHALRSSFEKGQLFVVYQPQIDFKSRLGVGAEALLRWKTEDGAYISPDRFIPIAEYSGLIIALGEWVLRTACHELVRIRQAGFHDFTMSINVSQAQFRHPCFLDMLRTALRETGAPPESIELEITESMAMEKPDLFISLLEEIKNTGIKIAIDDFGTGFSSLSYLQRLPVDRLKIDRAFVTEINSSARGSSIASMIISLGHNLGLTIIAEGVEDERQANILTNLGCPQAQGFLFGKPMLAPLLMEWITENNHANH
jgi:diguanylate cyclase